MQWNPNESQRSQEHSNVSILTLLKLERVAWRFGRYYRYTIHMFLCKPTCWNCIICKEIENQSWELSLKSADFYRANIKAVRITCTYGNSAKVISDFGSCGYIQTEKSFLGNQRIPSPLGLASKQNNQSQKGFNKFDLPLMKIWKTMLVECTLSDSDLNSKIHFQLANVFPKIKMRLFWIYFSVILFYSLEWKAIGGKQL